MNYMHYGITLFAFALSTNKFFVPSKLRSSLLSSVPSKAGIDTPGHLVPTFDGTHNSTTLGGKVGSKVALYQIIQKP